MLEPRVLRPPNLLLGSKPQLAPTIETAAYSTTSKVCISLPPKLAGDKMQTFDVVLYHHCYHIIAATAAIITMIVTTTIAIAITTTTATAM